MDSVLAICKGRGLGNGIAWSAYRAIIITLSLLAPSSYSARGNSGQKFSSDFVTVEFLTEPRDVLVVQGKGVRFDCAVRCSVNHQVAWYKDGSPLNYDNRRYKLGNDSLIIESVRHSTADKPDEGLYHCHVVLGGGAAGAISVGSVISRRARLSVLDSEKLSFSSHPKPLSVALGESALFSCIITSIHSSDVTSIRWLLNNKHLISSSRPGNRYLIVESELSGHGDRTSILEIAEVAGLDYGTYHCEILVNGAMLTSERAALLRASAMTDEITAPRLTLRPSVTLSSVEGGSIILPCGANGKDRNGRKPSITWLKSGATIDTRNPEGRFTVVGQGSLHIKRLERLDSGLYTCRASNLEDSMDADSGLTVRGLPRFTKKPSSISAVAGSDVQFDCSVQSESRITITWLKNGDVVVPSDYFVIADGRNLRILGLMESDAGMYQCLVENEVGIIHASAQLIVLPKDSSTINARSLPQTSLIKTGTLLMEDSREEILSAPIGLSTTHVTDHVISLTWTHPSVHHVTNDRLSGYLITWREPGSERERSLEVTGTEANIEQLKPSTTYQFKVKAFNSKGQRSAAAEISVTTTAQDTLPGPPTNVTVSVQSPTSMLVSWGPPSGLDPSSPVTFYKLYYHGSFEAATGDSDVTVVETEQLLKDLLKFHEYRIKVVAFNKHGPGTPSEEIKVTTYSDIPSATPTSFTVEAVGSTTISVVWEAPAEDQQNGIITGYKIQYRQRRDRKGNTETTDGARRTLDLIDLERGTEYGVRIQALTVNGSGPFTGWSYVETFLHDLDESSVPAKPTSLRVRPLINSIVVSWTPPDEQDVMIRGYVLRYGIGHPEEYSQYLDARQRYHTIKNLKSLSQYVISLSAFNNKGEGEPIYETTFTREETTPEPSTPMMPPVGLKAVALSSTTIILTWSDASLGMSQRVVDNRFYTVRYNAIGQRKYKQVNTTDFSLSVDDLRPDSEYEFCVKVIKGSRHSTWSLSAFNRTREAAPSSTPRDLTPVLISDATSVTLNWQPPRQPNGQITGYFILYTTDASLDDSEWVVDAVLGDRLSLNIRDLTPETTYYFKIQAKNSIGAGPMSPTVIFRTPRADGTGGGIIQTPDDFGQTGTRGNWPLDSVHYGKGGMNTRDQQGAYGGIPPFYLWIGIACIGGFVIVIVVIIIVVCIMLKRRVPEVIEPKHSRDSLASDKSKSSRGELKPPDLWIHHGNIEMSSDDRDSDLESASTVGRGRNPRSPRDLYSPIPGGIEEERYRTVPMRPLPTLLPVDTHTPLLRDHELPSSVLSSQVVPSSCLYQRSHFSSTPRVNLSDISNPSTVRSTKQLTGASTPHRFKLPTLAAPTLSSPIPPAMAPCRTAEIQTSLSHAARANILPSLMNSESNEELTQETVHLEGLMKDLSNITKQQTYPD